MFALRQNLKTGDSINIWPFTLNFFLPKSAKIDEACKIFSNYLTKFVEKVLWNFVERKLLFKDDSAKIVEDFRNWFKNLQKQKICPGFEPETFVFPVRCSTIRPTELTERQGLKFMT